MLDHSGACLCRNGYAPAARRSGFQSGPWQFQCEWHAGSRLSVLTVRGGRVGMQHDLVRRGSGCQAFAVCRIMIIQYVNSSCGSA